MAGCIGRRGLVKIGKDHQKFGACTRRPGPPTDGRVNTKTKAVLRRVLSPGLGMLSDVLAVSFLVQDHGRLAPCCEIDRVFTRCQIHAFDTSLVFSLAQKYCEPLPPSRCKRAIEPTVAIIVKPCPPLRNRWLGHTHTIAPSNAKPCSHCFFQSIDSSSSRRLRRHIKTSRSPYRSQSRNRP